ncbi:MAG: hypothetical protein P8185_03005 [Deltaproteobacteria bacterium]
MANEERRKYPRVQIFDPISKNESGQFSIGIQLTGSEAENLRFVRALVKSYHYQKEKSHLTIAPGIQN